MKLESRYLFLITAIVGMIYLAGQIYKGLNYNGNFWIALWMVIMGLYLFKYPIENRNE